jgi:hypothetical protein
MPSNDLFLKQPPTPHLCLTLARFDHIDRRIEREPARRRESTSNIT